LRPSSQIYKYFFSASSITYRAPKGSNRDVIIFTLKPNTIFTLVESINFAILLTNNTLSNNTSIDIYVIFIQCTGGVKNIIIIKIIPKTINNEDSIEQKILFNKLQQNCFSHIYVHFKSIKTNNVVLLCSKWRV
jgi:hypothetical protein